ncbi:transmembrane protein, putative (macronuclear) [Tetrahymena thermophila SB210]|uniref:Transmembrane protein, putative n=1 Tax=Tetrahymena thermophila (strain SB210) TaxID=312017 RepID=Q22LS4_TETTS|nr:transmembrane protein, putative [Tetrahymena thermophila SB210]EAR86192.3 transmembrane protein, putative [Tetrahymena thermophila SB210]|eukprot:XP_976787.3 transmembrane protein, putative [Tetrahymena thermophila SB210]
MIADEENNNNNNNNEENDNNINNNNDNNNQNMQPQGQEFYPGSYFSSFLIDGYAEDKYKNTVTQICQNKNLHLLIGLLECLVCNSIIVFYYFTQLYAAFLAMIAILGLQIILTFLQNLTCYKQNSKSIAGNMYAYFLLDFILSALSLDVLLFIRFCLLEADKIQKTEKIFFLQNFILKFVRRFILKIFFSFARSVVIITFFILNTNLEKKLSLNSCFMLAYIFLNMIISAFFLFSYATLFIFSIKQSIIQQIITFFEILIELTMSYCIITFQIYNFFLIYITYMLFAIQYFSFYCKSPQTNFLFNPMNLSIFGLVFMAFKISYLSSLYNCDLYQYEMLIINKKNQFSYAFYNLYLGGIYTILFYLFQGNYPTPIPQLLLFCGFYSGVLMIIKFFLIVKMTKQCKVYDFSSIQQVEQLNTKQDYKCRLTLNFKFQLKKDDFMKLTKYIDFNSQFCQINFENQFSIELVHNFCRMKIVDLKSEEISQFFGYFMSKSSFFSVQALQVEQDFKNNYQVCSKILSCLRQVSIVDQTKFNLKDSDFLMILRSQEYYNNLQHFLRYFNVEKVIMDLVTFYKYISIYQYVNPSNIIYDLYDI